MTEPTLADLGLSPALSAGAMAVGWVRATPIQAEAIPVVLRGQDLLAQAPTGSGKTAAFLLPMLQRLLAGPLDERPRRLRALVLAPTRELAIQIDAAVQSLAPALRSVLAVGGASINPQMMALRGGAHIVVATPGRLLDLVAQHALTVGALDMLVLDEADRLLDLGFADELARVHALLPAQRQTLLLSATVPPGVRDLARQWLTDPAEIGIDAVDVHPAPAIGQRAIVVDRGRRTALLRHLLRSEPWSRTLVFVASQYAAEHVADKLRQSGVAATALHGAQSQGRRRQALSDLRQGALNVLVCTDLAARGIDVVGLSAVVNYDLPRSADDYTHRIGRTGRAGATGAALSFISADQPGSEAHFRLIEKRQQRRLAREQVPGFEPSATTAAAATAATGLDPNGGIKGRRKSKKDKLREAAALAARRR